MFQGVLRERWIRRGGTLDERAGREGRLKAR